MEANLKKKKCWECRRRRLVCDSTRPGCTKCQSAGRPCPGYGLNKPLKWMQTPQHVEFRHVPRRQLASSSGNTDSQESDLDSHARSLPSGSPTTTEGPATPFETRDGTPEDICQPSTGQIMDPCAQRMQNELEEIFESVEYWNTFVCPDLVATGKGGQANPFFLPRCIVSQLPRSAVLTVVSTAIGHRLLQSHAPPTSPSARAALTTKLQHHRGESIRALTADLAEQDKQLTDGTLGAVLALLLAEIQQTFSPSWQQHLTGAATIINLRGGFGHLVLTNASFRYVYRYYAIIDIMGSTTSPHISPESARNQLETIDLMPILYGNGLETGFPCPPALFTLIIRINHLRAQFQAAQGSLSVQDRYACALDLLNQVRSCPIDSWARTATFESSSHGVSTRPSPGFGQWQSVARIFQCAVDLYCIASLLHHTSDTSSGGVTFPQLSPQTVLASTRKRSQEMLLQELGKIQACAQLRKMLLWPVVMAGIGAGDEATRSVIENELDWISKTMGTASPLLARRFLKGRVWDLGLGMGEWTGMFDRAYMFAI
ncbi:arginine metabolism regulation protein II [Podospora conica]|nr:arginine metabolism regulation protein II [Schizothecium conicum]